MIFRQRILQGVMLALALTPHVPAAVSAAPPVTLTHVHGLAYSADGKQLMIPSHNGLAVYAEGRWSKAAQSPHDYMGLSATRNALYSSGHPAPGSGRADPFGLIKSTDGGKTWRKLGMEGESDFHTLATSRETNVVYVANRQQNTRMSRTGIHYTLDNGAHWRRSEAQGLGGPIHQLAVHPADPKLVAAASDAGLYLSRDQADNFERLGDPGYVLAVSFDLDGEHLWSSSYAAGKSALMRIRLTGGSEARDVPLPALTDDAVAHIAQNPARQTEIAIATFNRNVFVSKDLGRTWTQIAVAGVTQE